MYTDVHVTNWRRVSNQTACFRLYEKYPRFHSKC